MSRAAGAGFVPNMAVMDAQKELHCCVMSEQRSINFAEAALTSM